MNGPLGKIMQAVDRQMPDSAIDITASVSGRPLQPCGGRTSSDLARERNDSAALSDVPPAAVPGALVSIEDAIEAIRVGGDRNDTIARVMKAAIAPPAPTSDPSPALDIDELERAIERQAQIPWDNERLERECAAISATSLVMKQKGLDHPTRTSALIMAEIARLLHLLWKDPSAPLQLGGTRIMGGFGGAPRKE